MTTLEQMEADAGIRRELIGPFPDRHLRNMQHPLYGGEEINGEEIRRRYRLSGIPVIGGVAVLMYEQFRVALNFYHRVTGR